MTASTDLGDYAACTYSAAFANGHTRQDGDIASNPNILLDGYRFTCLRTLSAIAEVRIKRVSPRIQADVRTHQGSSTNGDQAGVDDSTVEVDENIRSQPQVGTVVSMERWFDPGILVKLSFIFCFRSIGFPLGQRSRVSDDTGDEEMMRTRSGVC